jgi:ribonuclease D
MSASPEPFDAPVLVDEEEHLRRIAATASSARRLGLDVEASGMHAYRARPCAVQLAWDAGRSVAVVDPLASPLAPLVGILGAGGPVKIVHDVAFDARILAESGIALERVHDTAIAARMLGRTATGLATLLESELGIRVSKALQQHDWRIRPIDDAMMTYLSEDVRYLEALESRLWTELAERGIEDAVLEETTYRLACAAASVDEPRNDLPYLRVKGSDKLKEPELAALRAIVSLREDEAAARDVPPHRVASAETLLCLARTRPTTAAAVARVRGLSPGLEGQAFAEALARALAAAPRELPDDERERLRPQRMPAEMVRDRREREARLMAWRREQAKQRGVDEQVLLPGHCLKDAVSANVATAEELARVPGIGAFRVERDGEAILRALRGEGPPA